MHDIRKWGVIVTGILAMTAGSAVLMWIGEQITEKGVGNGISIVLTITSFQVCLVILLTYSRTLYLKKECQSVVDYYQHALFWAL